MNPDGKRKPVAVEETQGRAQQHEEGAQRLSRIVVAVTSALGALGLAALLILPLLRMR